jgi:putative ABC transport system substrate-binding protein
MRRRIVLACFVCGFLAAPCAYAQQAQKIFRVGFLWDNPAVFADAMTAFRTALRDLGWIEGKNISLEYRWSEGHYDRIQQLAEELVRLKVDVIVAPSSIYTGAAKRATSTIPIVFLSHADPIGSGHVSSLARPDGNITGFALMMTETNAKLVELLRDAVPALLHIAVLWDPATPSHGPGLKAVEAASRALGLRLSSYPVRSPPEFAGAFAAMVREGAGGVLVLSTPLFIAERRQLAELAIQHKLPTMFGPRSHVDSGGLLSYGPDRADLWRRGASYVDRILKGAKPANLPVQQPTKFELSLNRKTAKVLGLTIPPDFMVRVDTVVD